MFKKSLFASLYIMFCLSVFGYFSFNTNVSIDLLKSQPVFILQISQLFNALLAFLVPTAAYIFFFKKKNFTLLDLHSPPSLKGISNVSLLFIIALPAIGFLANWNSNIHLPASFSALEEKLRAAEEIMQSITLLLLDMRSMTDLLMNVFIIGFIAAFTEEVFFRGMVQNHLMELSQKPHIAIWITAIVFSFLHGQFFGFFPRMLLGAMLGYVYYFSNNLWIPIIGHFINNGLQVVITYIMLQSHSLEELSDLQIGGDSLGFALFSTLTTISALVYWSSKNIQKDL